MSLAQLASHKKNYRVGILMVFIIRIFLAFECVSRELFSGEGLLPEYLVRVLTAGYFEEQDVKKL